MDKCWYRMHGLGGCDVSLSLLCMLMYDVLISTSKTGDSVRVYCRVTEDELKGRNQCRLLFLKLFDKYLQIS